MRRTCPLILPRPEETATNENVNDNEAELKKKKKKREAYPVKSIRSAEHRFLQTENVQPLGHTPHRAPECATKGCDLDDRVLVGVEVEVAALQVAVAEMGARGKHTHSLLQRHLSQSMRH